MGRSPPSQAHCAPADFALLGALSSARLAAVPRSPPWFKQRAARAADSRRPTTTIACVSMLFLGPRPLSIVWSGGGGPLSLVSFFMFYFFFFPLTLVTCQLPLAMCSPGVASSLVSDCHKQGPCSRCARLVLLLALVSPRCVAMALPSARPKCLNPQTAVAFLRGAAC